MAKKPPLGNASVYSIRLEIDGQEKVITLRVGDKFTELSLIRDGELSELIREERNEIRYEKFR